MEYYSAIQRNELLISAAIQMDLKGIMSEKSQSQKITYCMIPFIKHSQKENCRYGEQIHGCQGLAMGVQGFA